MKTVIKRIMAAVVLLLGPMAMAAEFQTTVTLEGPQIRKAGAEVEVKVTGTHPEGYVVAGWKIDAYVRHLPEKFAEKTGLKINVNPDPKWSYVTLVPYVWRKGEEQNVSEFAGRFKTAGWPKGDYCLNCILFMRVKAKPEGATDKYVSGKFVLSLE